MTDAADWDGERYDRLADPQARWGDAVLARLRLAGDESVLDAGCGSGRVTQALLDRLPRGHVVAVDASPSMLAAARRRLSGAADRVTFVCADLLELTPDALGGHAPVDAVLSTATFHWVTDHERLFARLAGVLAPGGALVAQFGGHGNIERVISAVRSLGVERAGDWHYPTVEQTRARLLAAGFTDVEVFAHPEPTPFPDDEALAEFLEAVCLRQHVATLPPGTGRDFARRVAAAMGEPLIDYVRMNVVARRSER